MSPPLRDMQPSPRLLDIVRPEPGGCVALIGAGGKTTLMYELCDALAGDGLRTLAATTTKIWPPVGRTLVLAAGQPDFGHAVDEAFARGSVVVVGESVRADGKVHGLAGETLCALLARRVADVVVCEADGAAGRPLKLHGPGEPCIPTCTHTVVVVAGCDAVGRPALPDAVHRAEHIKARLGLRAGAPLRPDRVAAALVSASTHAPAGAHVLFAINKVDTPERLDAAREVGRALCETVPGSRIALTTWGHLVEIVDSRDSGSLATR